MTKYLLGISLLALPYSVVHAGDDISQKRVQEDSTIGSYRWIADAPSGARFQLVQRIPDQTRSFYNVRGFPINAADVYATSCVMQTIFNNNTNNKVVSFNLADWTITHNGVKKPLKLTTEWMDEWKKMGVSQSARIAFRWSQFPTVQKHQPGDWFQGMIAAGLPGGSSFDLGIKWTENGVTHTATIKDVQCAKDRILGGKK